MGRSRLFDAETGHQGLTQFPKQFPNSQYNSHLGFSEVGFFFSLYLCTRRKDKPLAGAFGLFPFGRKRDMTTKLVKVVAQSEPVYVPSKKSENGQLAKSMIRLKEMGGEHADEYICAMFGNLALCRFDVGKSIIVSLRFQTRESNGVYYQDVVVTDFQEIN